MVKVHLPMVVVEETATTVVAEAELMPEMLTIGRTV